MDSFPEGQFGAGRLLAQYFHTRSENYGTVPPQKLDKVAMEVARNLWLTSFAIVRFCKFQQEVFERVRFRAFPPETSFVDCPSLMQQIAIWSHE